MSVLLTQILSVACGGGMAAAPEDLVPEGATLALPPPGAAQPVPIMPTSFHVPEGQPVEYNSTPSTSGDHWERWADCGFYPRGLPDEPIVHNLEHGNIVVSYNLQAREDVLHLRGAVRDISFSARWGVIRHFEKTPPGTVAVAAWGILDTMEGVDGSRIAALFNAYAGNLGPERIPC